MLLIGTGIFIVSLAAAQPAPTPSGLENLQALIVISGTCERLVIAGRDASAGCRRAVVNLVYRNGRSSFGFTEGDERMVSFSGITQTSEGDEAEQALDMVTVAAEDGRSVDSAPASGSCAFSNPYRGRSYLRCRASTPAGVYEASFTSDGQPPSVHRMPPQ